MVIDDTIVEKLQQRLAAPIQQHLVLSVSDNPLIRDIFRYRYWCPAEAMLYLTGIYQLLHDDADEKKRHLTALDGKQYSDPEDSRIIEDFCLTFDRLSRIWAHANLSDLHTPGFYLRWGLRRSEVFEISWLPYAVTHRLVQQEWLKSKKQAEEEEGKDLTDPERKSLLKIIAALLTHSKIYLRHGDIKKVSRLLDNADASMSENTLSKYLKEAEEYIPDHRNE